MIKHVDCAPYQDQLVFDPRDFLSIRHSAFAGDMRTEKRERSALRQYIVLFLYELSEILFLSEVHWNTEKKGTTHALDTKCFTHKYIEDSGNSPDISQNHSTHGCPLHSEPPRVGGMKLDGYREFYTSCFVWYYFILNNLCTQAAFVMLWRSFLHMTTLQTFMCSSYYYFTLYRQVLTLFLYLYGTFIGTMGVCNRITGKWLTYAFRCTVSNELENLVILADLGFSVFTLGTVFLAPMVFGENRIYNLIATPILNLAYMFLPWIILLRWSFDFIYIFKMQRVGRRPYLLVCLFFSLLMMCMLVHLFAVYLLPDSVVISCIKGEVPV